MVQGNAANILVVEDEPSVADVIEQQLLRSGYGVLAKVATGDEAIELALECNPDVVLMDVNLAGRIDGVETAKVIQEKTDIPVVFLTAYSDDVTFQRISNLKPYGYLIKPVNQTELSFAVGLALEQARAKQQLKVLGEKGAASVSGTANEEILATQAEYSVSANKEVISALRKVSVFAKLPEQNLAQLAQRGVRKYYEAGQNIFYEGQEEKSGFIVISGCVSMIKSSSARARELIVDTVIPGDPSGLLAMIERVPSWFTARAQEDSDVLMIGSSLLLNLLDQQPQCYREIVVAVTEKLRTSYNFSKTLAYDSVEERIAGALAFLAEKAGYKDSKTGMPSLRLTRRELADFTGTTVETAYRVTKKMERDGYIQLPNPGLIAGINVKKLKTLESF